MVNGLLVGNNPAWGDRQVQTMKSLSPEVLTEEQFFDETINTDSWCYSRLLRKKILGRAAVTQPKTQAILTLGN